VATDAAITGRYVANPARAESAGFAFHESGSSFVFLALVIGSKAFSGLVSEGRTSLCVNWMPIRLALP
jgi:hypothetical protein